MEGLGIRLSSDSALVAAMIGESSKQNPKTIEKSLVGLGGNSDSADVGLDSIYKSLTVLADKVVSKLNELLKKDLPEGIGSLNPIDHTAEKTSDRIVQGATALLPIFASQNPDLTGEELINSFMSTIRGGIDSGYKQAAAILGELGAFEFDGVKSGIEKTMSLVGEKLIAFENNYRKQHGLPVTNEEASATESSVNKSSSVSSQNNNSQRVRFVA